MTTTALKAFSRQLQFGFCSLGILFSLFLVYTGWNNPFIADDGIHIFQNRLLSGPLEFSMLFDAEWESNGSFTWAYRPLYYFTFWVESQAWGINPGRIRLVNLLIHLLNILILCAYGFREKAFKTTPLFTSMFLLLLLHPICWHSIFYASARSTLLVSTFILLSLLFFQRTDRLKYLFLPSSIAAIATKQTGILAPVVVSIYWLRSLINHKLRPQKKQILGALMALAILAGFFIFYRIETILGFYRSVFSATSLVDYPAYLMTQTYINFRYFVEMVFPLNGSFYYFYNPILTWRSYRFFLGVFFFILFIFFIVTKRRENYATFFGFSIICLLPEFLYPRELIGTEQRIYLPLLFATLGFFSWLEKQTVNTKKVFLFCSTILCLFNSYRSYERGKIYSNIESTFQRCLTLNDQNLYAHSHIAEHYLSQGLISKAQHHFKIGMQLSEELKEFLPYFRSNLFKTAYKYYYTSHELKDRNGMRLALQTCPLRKSDDMNCALIHATDWFNRGNFQKVLSHLSQKQALTVAEIHLLAKANWKFGQYDSALSVLDVAKTAFPFDFSLNYLRFRILWDIGKKAKASEELRAFIEEVRSFQPARASHLMRLLEQRESQRNE
jgi:tetratricopeptide (TPR) repeat protein